MTDRIHLHTGVCVDSETRNFNRMRSAPGVSGVIHCWGEKRKTRLHRITARGREVLAEHITGTLYCPKTGECLTSPLLRVVL